MIPNSLSPYIYSVVRVVFGFLWVLHGMQKYGVFGDDPIEMGSLRGIAGLIEIVAGALITVGLFTRPAAFIASGQMAAAYFISHFPRAFWPIHNGGEPAVLFCFVFLYIASRGAGMWSIDERRTA